MELIYLDNNATTPVLPEVWEAMQPFWTEIPGNPASSHAYGRRARKALEDARDRTADLLGAAPEEIIITSGATEANNLALFGLAGPTPGHLLVSAIEHPCVTEPAAKLAENGFSLEILPVDSEGKVKDFTQSVRDDTCLVSVMLANHETGTIQPVPEMAGSIPPGIPFHCDAAAAAGKIAISFRDLNVTSMTISAHKFHGPKGIGVLVLKKGNRLHPQIFGGHQQQGKRPGTESVPLAVGLAEALEVAVQELESRTAKVINLRGAFLEILREKASPIVLNGPEEGGIPHTINLSFPGCQADILLMNLDLAGVACSTGSACSSGSLLPSPVLKAMRVAPEVLGSAMRFSLSSLLELHDVAEAAQRISEVVQRLRTGENQWQ